MAFEAIARLGGMSAAARELGVTRSALSRSVDLLEHRLQVRLFRQTFPSVEMTQAGTRYVDAVQHFAATLGDSLYRLSPGARTTLHIEAAPEFSRLWLGERLSRFHTRHPRIDLSVTLLRTDEQALAQQADVILRYGDAPAGDLLSLPLWQEQVVALATPAMAKKAMQTPVEELPHRFPLIEIPAFSWRHWLAAPHGDRAAQSARCVTPDLVYGLHMAARGFGIALGPLRLVQHHLRSGLCALASAQKATGSSYQAITLNANAPRLPVAAFMRWLADEVHSNPP